MFPAATKGGGTLATTGPLDVCKTPSPGGPVPAPYLNMAQCTSADGGSCSQKTKFDGKKVCTTKTKVNRSSGDELGSVGGLISNRNMSEVQYKTGSDKVRIEGQKCAHITSMTGHNGSNANVPAGAQVAPSQTKVIVGL